MASLGLWYSFLFFSLLFFLGVERLLEQASKRAEPQSMLIMIVASTLLLYLTSFQRQHGLSHTRLATSGEIQIASQSHSLTMNRLDPSLFHILQSVSGITCPQIVSCSCCKLMSKSLADGLSWKDLTGLIPVPAKNVISHLPRRHQRSSSYGAT